MCYVSINSGKFNSFDFKAAQNNSFIFSFWFKVAGVMCAYHIYLGKLFCRLRCDNLKDCFFLETSTFAYYVTDLKFFFWFRCGGGGLFYRADLTQLTRLVSLYPLKRENLWYFQGVSKETSGMNWINQRKFADTCWIFVYKNAFM